MTEGASNPGEPAAVGDASGSSGHMHRLATLGRLSAGLAHELANPAAAAQRAAARLSELQSRLPRLLANLMRHQMDEDELAKLLQLRERWVGTDPTELALDRGAREEAVGSRLEELGVADAWAAGAALAEGGIILDDIDDLAAHLPRSGLADALAWLSVDVESGRVAQEIRDATQRISELASSIKTFAHTGRTRDRKPTDVRRSLEATVTMLGHKLRQKSVRLRRDFEEVPLVPANAGELGQVWTNFLDNALDAVKEEGSIGLEVRREDSWVVVDVIDDGPGIPADVRARIFEPFFTTKEASLGSGLGLGIAREIVEAHGGRIEVHSRAGETIMRTWLPVAKT